MRKNSTRGLVGIVAGAAGVVLLAGAASAATPGISASGEPSVLVFDQTQKNGAINITYAYLPKKGYVVVYGADANGKPSGEPVAHVALEAGDHRNVSIKLTTVPAAGSKLWASLYEDRDGKAGFVKGADVSFWADGKLPLENAFTVR